MQLLTELLDRLPEELRRQAFTHASWSEEPGGSYERLAFLGDSVLGLAISAHIYPLLGQESYGAGQLTRIRAQTVSGAACRQVGERLDVAGRLRAAAPAGQALPDELFSERVIASVVEAAIGACFLHEGYEPTAAAVVEAFQPELAEALEHPVDFKSALQERLAETARRVEYATVAEEGPPHDLVFEVQATVDGQVVGQGSGRTRKAAEQQAAMRALEGLDGGG
ncbi:MAG: ribonuclease III [Solirubrobacteraceae bacterium]|nr:ribonuclease III [Solirubrobacteraceae bacterium]